jgi:hypothetical protein
MPEVKYDTSHHAGATAEARLHNSSNHRVVMGTRLRRIPRGRIRQYTMVASSRAVGRSTVVVRL